MFFTVLRVWLWNMLIWIDQGLNVGLAIPLNLIFKPHEDHMFGSADETLSSVFGKNKSHNSVIDGGRRAINALFFWQEDHCQSSVEWDESIRYKK